MGSISYMSSLSVLTFSFWFEWSAKEVTSSVVLMQIRMNVIRDSTPPNLVENDPLP